MRPSDKFMLKIGANGSLIDRINGETIDQPIETIAIDGQGRLAWCYSGNLVMTGDNGKLLGQLKIEPLGDIEYNQKGELVGISRSPSKEQINSFGQ